MGQGGTQQHPPTFFLNSARLSRQSFAASTLAGDSSLGDDSMLITDSTMDSTWVHRREGRRISGVG